MFLVPIIYIMVHSVIISTDFAKLYEAQSKKALPSTRGKQMDSGSPLDAVLVSGQLEDSV